MLKNMVLYVRQTTVFEICGDPTAAKHFGTPEKPSSNAESTGLRSIFTSFQKCSSRIPEGNIIVAVTTTLDELMPVHLGDAALMLKAEKRRPVTETVLNGIDATDAAMMKATLIVTFVALT